MAPVLRWAIAKPSHEGSTDMSNLFRNGGYLASAVLILFGAGSIGIGALGFAEVRDTIKAENITATPDAQDIGVNLEPGQPIETGAQAKEFATIIRTHALAGTEGRTFAEMGRFLTETGEETNNPDEAATDAEGRPVANPARDTWITATALTTALNTAFMAERIAVFAMVMGAALLLTGIGFLVLTMGGPRPTEEPWRPDAASRPSQPIPARQ
jgi:hypothetical protein